MTPGAGTATFGDGGARAGRAANGGTVLDRVDEVLGRWVSMRSLALLRILIGPVVLLHLRPFVDDALDGRIYRDSFYEPYAAWYPELPRALYCGLLYLGAVAAVALSLGVATRVTSVVTFGVVAYNLFLSTTHVHNNRAFLVIVLAGLAVAPCGRELSVDAWLRRRRGRPPLDPRAPAWPLWLLRFEASVLYGASGMSKLLDPDWFGGTVTWHRVTQHRADLAVSPLPAWVVDLLLERGFHTFAAKVIVLTELAIAAGLWSRRTRYAAVWLAVCFHVAIQLTASVEVFSYLAVAALVIWAVPSPGDRTLALDRSLPSHRRLAATVGALDWLARFRVVDGPSGGVAGRGDVVGARGGRAGNGRGPVVTDRDGSVLAGRPAVAFVLSRLPLTAWFALPTLLLPAVRRARSSSPALSAPGAVSGPPTSSGTTQPARGETSSSGTPMSVADESAAGEAGVAADATSAVPDGPAGEATGPAGPAGEVRGQAGAAGMAQGPDGAGREVRGARGVGETGTRAGER